MSLITISREKYHIIVSLKLDENQNPILFLLYTTINHYRILSLSIVVCESTNTILLPPPPVKHFWIYPCSPQSLIITDCIILLKFYSVIINKCIFIISKKKKQKKLEKWVPLNCIYKVSNCNECVKYEFNNIISLYTKNYSGRRQSISLTTCVDPREVVRGGKAPPSVCCNKMCY